MDCRTKSSFFFVSACRPRLLTPGASKRPHSDPGPTDIGGRHLDENRRRRRSQPGRQSPAAAVATWPTIAGSSGCRPADDRPRLRSLFGRQLPAAAVATNRPRRRSTPGRHSPAAAVATWPTLTRGGCATRQSIVLGGGRRPADDRPRRRAPPGRQSPAPPGAARGMSRLARVLYD